MIFIVRILLIPVALVLFVAFQLWEVIDQFPSYARSVWNGWRINSSELSNYVRSAFNGEKESDNG